MRIVGKKGDEIVLLQAKDEMIEKGDYLTIEDKKSQRKLVVQVYDEDYLETASLTQDIVRDEILQASSEEQVFDPLNVGNLSLIIRDARLFKCKIRAGVELGKLSSNVTWLPSRVDSRIYKLKISELDGMLERRGQYPMDIGSTRDGEMFSVYAEDLDGHLSVITGKKGTGKSHLAKTLVKRLVELGAFVIIFDLNNEYAGLAWNIDGSPSTLNDRIVMLEPGGKLKFTIDYVGKGSFSNMLRHAMDMPPASLREFFRIWDWLETRGNLEFSKLFNVVSNWDTNELVRDALTSRIHAIWSSRLFTDDAKNSFKIENSIRHSKNGLALIVGMAKVSPIVRRMIVELMLSKLIELLEKGSIPPIFLFAEEAHLYVRDTYWEDIITRMRHFGIYTTFVTNQPDAISESIYRQVDNVFLFNFTNDLDLERISRISVTDTDTIKSIVRTLPQRYCLILGRVAADLPMVVKIKQAEVLVLGQTKRFFKTEILARQKE